MTWYKQYRDILESDLIHVRRADGRDIDYMIQVNPRLTHRAISMVHNPLDTVRRAGNAAAVLHRPYRHSSSSCGRRPRDFLSAGRSSPDPRCPVDIPAHGRITIVVQASQW